MLKFEHLQATERVQYINISTGTAYICYVEKTSLTQRHDYNGVLAICVMLLY
jgi:hypothetical protein